MNGFGRTDYCQETSQSSTKAAERSWSKPNWAKNGENGKKRQREKRRENRKNKRRGETHCIDWYKRGNCKRDGCKFKHDVIKEEVLYFV